MKSSSLTRREFLAWTSAGTIAALAPAALRAAGAAAPPRWPIGCFNRPWTKWSLDEAFSAIHDAGYSLTGLLTPTKTEVFTAAKATTAYLQALKQKIAAHGLRANMTALRVRNDLDLDLAIADMRRQLANARIVGVEFVLTFGEARPERYGKYYRLMADAAAFGQQLGLKLVLKPHGGGSGASEEILRCIQAVDHPNFKVWYDAGNIIYYTGKDPIAELEPIVQHVTGFCAKDCAGPKSDVMIQFGTGKVDFAGVFRKLKAAGFNGPIMVECCKIGPTAHATMENARANREFLERTLAAL